MQIMLPIVLLLGAVSLRYFWTAEKQILLTIKEFCFIAINVYLLLLASVIPLVFFNYWTPLLQAAVIAIFSFVPGLLLLRKLIKGLRFRVDFKPLKILLYVSAVLLGVLLQKDSIWYFYGTHDPGVYLTAAQHLSTTHHFSHTDEIAALAYGDGHPKLKALLNLKNAPEDWQLSSNYGVIPSAQEKEFNRGIGYFHGMVGEPLALAIGTSLFGAVHCLRTHWIHLAISALLLIGLAQIWIGEGALWPWLSPLLLCLCPLVVTLYREPTSEPLAQVLFLGFLFALSSTEKVRPRARYDLLISLAAVLLGVLVRISGLLYFPFYALTVVIYLKKDRKFITGFLLSALVGLVLISFTVFKTSPGYLAGIFQGYTDLNSRMFSFFLRDSVAKVAAAFFLASGALALFYFRKKLSPLVKHLISTRGRKIYWIVFFSLWIVGLVARYRKLILVNSQYIGGYPFVLYQLDSLLFYGSPLVMLAGFYFLFRALIKESFNRVSFLHFFVPFCLLFYTVYRFWPLNLQPNFQRYLLIELIPLGILGTVVGLHQFFSNRRFRPALRTGLVLSLFWNAGLIYAINHRDECEHTFSDYKNFAANLNSLKNDQKKPVLVAFAPTWQETAFLMPLATAYEIPVVFVNQGFSYAESQGIDELSRLGYTPVLALGEAGGQAAKVQEGGRLWEPWKKFNDCYLYPKFGLGAPPLELENTCGSFSLLRTYPNRLVLNPVNSKIISPAFSYAHSRNAFSVKHWVGFEIDGRPLCRGDKKAVVELMMNPASSGQPPTAFLNGERLSSGRNISSAGNGRSQSLRITLDKTSVPCREQNVLDIFFLPDPPFSSPREGVVLGFGVEREGAPSAFASDDAVGSE